MPADMSATPMNQPTGAAGTQREGHEMVSLVLPEIRELIAANELSEIRHALEDWHEVDLAALLQEFEDSKEQLVYFRAWNRDEALRIFEELDDETMATLLENLTHRERLWLVNSMSPDERADLFAEVEAEDRHRLLALLSPKARAEIQRLLIYPPDTAGGIMTTAFVAVAGDATVEEATRIVRQAAQTAETIYTVYVTDAAGVLGGVVSLRTLILSRAETPVSEVMETAIISANVSEDQEEVAYRLRTYDLTAIPVVEEGGRLVGIVTVDDVLDVIREEETEDTLRMAAIETYETAYLETPVWILARQRATWLLVLVLAGFISGYVLESYQGFFAIVGALVIFIPVLTGSGGNAGTQVSTTIIRSLATHELTPRDILVVVRKEIGVGLLVGGVMGLMTAVRALFVSTDPMMIATVGIAMATVVTTAALIGGILPLVLRRIGLDPALMSSPLIATVTDSLALIIYFEIARRLLHL